MSTTIEKVNTLIMMYKKDKITDYVLERELGAYFGNNVSVKLEKDTTNSGTSYCVFAVPERRTEGFHITFIMDARAIKEFYVKEEEFAVVCQRLKNKIQPILQKYHTFYNEHFGKEVGKNIAIGFLMGLYDTYRGDLIVESDSFVPDAGEVLKYADKFSTEEANSEDLETIKIKGFISNEIIDMAMKYVKKAEISYRVIEKDKPTFCFGAREIAKHCTSTFGVRDHKEIPYDYIPKTNQ